MAQTTNAKSTLYGMRAEQLAVVYLTRRNDLDVETAEYRNGDSYIDLLANIAHKSQVLPRRFGVEIKASLESSHRSIMLREAVNQVRHTHTPDIPICLFFFAVRNDEGYYAWLKEPKIAENGQPYLSIANYDRHVRSTFEPLNDEAIDTIVKQVDRWYDAKYEKKSAVSIAVPISKSKFAKLVSGGNLREIDVDKSFPAWVEEIRQGLHRSSHSFTFDVIPLEGKNDEGTERITADESIAQDVLRVIDETELDVLNHWREWATRLPQSRSRALPYV